MWNQDINACPHQLYENAIARKKAASKLTSKSDDQSGSLLITSDPQEASGPGLRVPIDPAAFTRAMDEFTIALACLTLESKDRHQKDAAGLVATVLYSRANDVLSPNQPALLIEPVPRMLQDERDAEVWIKVINLWLKEYRAHLFPKIDRLLDPYVMGAVNTLLEDEHRLRQI